MYGSSADKGNREGKGRFLEENWQECTGQGVGQRPEIHRDTPCLIQTLYTEMQQHTTYMVSMFSETSWLPEVQRKSAYGSRGTKEKHSQKRKDHPNKTREQLYSRNQWYKVLCIYGRALPLSWTYSSTMTTKNKPPGYTCLWHCLQFIKKLILCHTPNFLTFITKNQKKFAKLDPRFP